MEEDYKKEVELFQDSLKYYNMALISQTGNETNVCFTLIKAKAQKPEHIYLNGHNLKKMFKKSISCLGEPTKEYFNNALRRIKIIRQSSMENGYAEIPGVSKKMRVFVTKKEFQDDDFIAFSHEIGHVPVIKEGAKQDYYEYSEVLPMFFEFISSIYLYQEFAKSKLIDNRFYTLINEAEYFMGCNDEACNYFSYHLQYLNNKKREYYKYLLSFEYVLNLIDLFEKDPKTVIEAIDSVVCRYSSFRELEPVLGIDTKDCKKLLKISEIYR